MINPNSNIEMDSNLNLEKLNVVFLTCTYKRPEITKKVISQWEKVQKNTSSHFNYENIIVDSENTNQIVFNGNLNFEYYNYPNNPISNKWNFAVKKLKDKNFDYVIFLGSDDIVDENLMYYFYNKMKSGYDFIGIEDMYIFNTINNNLYYWKGYNEKSGRYGETIGLGRCLSKRLLTILDYAPWNDGLNKGLDGSMQIKLKKISNLSKISIRLSNDGGFACDIKSNFNITNIKDYNSNDFKLINKDEQVYKNTISSLGFNQTHINKDLSIIIPTFNNVEYIDECLNSILESSKNYNIEVLIGIDGCEKTLDYIKQKTYPDFVKFYYFNSNNGPYDIKNTLTQISNSENLLFFDSDDIITKTTISEIINNFKSYDLIRLKYSEFKDGKTFDKVNFGEGVFAIKKSVFLPMNGFEPWKVAADSDFMGRIYKKRPKIYHTKNISFYRRLHNQSLTKRSDTGMASPLRGGYAKMSKNKKGDGNPDRLHTRDFVLVDVNTIVVDTKNTEYYNHRKSVLDKVLNPVPRKVVGHPIKKKDPVINDRTDILYSTPKPIVRTIKPNKPDNRQDLINLKNNTNKSIHKELFNTKPERRTGINPITIGGKSRT